MFGFELWPIAIFLGRTGRILHQGIKRSFRLMELSLALNAQSMRFLSRECPSRPLFLPVCQHRFCPHVSEDKSNKLDQYSSMSGRKMSDFSLVFAKKPSSDWNVALLLENLWLKKKYALPTLKLSRSEDIWRRNSRNGLRIEFEKRAIVWRDSEKID